MSRYSLQPETPIRQSKPKTASLSPLTPQTPSLGFKATKNASPAAFRTPLSSYSNIAFTPPSSLPRAPSNSISKKTNALDSWRKPSGGSDSPTRPTSSNGMKPHSKRSFLAVADFRYLLDLLPSAFISTQRRSSIRKQDSPKLGRQTEQNIWSEGATEVCHSLSVDSTQSFSYVLYQSFSDGSEMIARQKSSPNSNSLKPTHHPRVAHQQQQKRPESHSNKNLEASAPKSVAVCAACASSTTDVMLSCSHAMCSGCFTASLNIVGEKPFSCPACSERILDFRFTSGFAPKASGEPNQQQSVNIAESVWDAPSLHESFGEVSLDQLAVLRLDDVPWVCIFIGT